jgi:hypothetical protein
MGTTYSRIIDYVHETGTGVLVHNIDIPDEISRIV